MKPAYLLPVSRFRLNRAGEKESVEYVIDNDVDFPTAKVSSFLYETLDVGGLHHVPYHRDSLATG